VGWPRSPNSASGFATELPPLPQALLRLCVVRCCVPHDVQRTARIIRRYAFKPRHAPYAPRSRRALGLSRRICQPLCALSGACDFVQVVGLAWGERVMHIIGSMTFKDEKNDLSLTLEVMSHPARYSMRHGPCLCTCCELGTAPAHPGTPFPLCATQGTHAVALPSFAWSVYAAMGGTHRQVGLLVRYEPALSVQASRHRPSEPRCGNAALSWPCVMASRAVLGAAA
jgi:hypothetical protein